MTKLDEKQLISLKEAAEVSGYSSDYIGQLIRNGKIPGKQVFTNITWMTTAEAVLEYKKNGRADKQASLADKVKARRRKITLELSILKLFFQTFKSAFPLLLTIIISFVLLSTYLVFNLLSPDKTVKNQPPIQREQPLTF